MANSKSDNVIEELRELTASCKSRDISVVPRIQHLLDQHAEITDHFGDAANVATEMWLFFYAGDNAFVAEATRRKMVSLRATISGPAPTQLEELMVDLIMVCWLRVHALVALQAQAFQGKASKAIVKEQERQLKASHLLYSQSLKQLAELRKMLPGGAGDPTDLVFPVVHSDSPQGNGISA